MGSRANLVKDFNIEYGASSILIMIAKDLAKC